MPARLQDIAIIVRRRQTAWRRHKKIPKNNSLFRMGYCCLKDTRTSFFGFSLEKKKKKYKWLSNSLHNLSLPLPSGSCIHVPLWQAFAAVMQFLAFSLYLCHSPFYRDRSGRNSHCRMPAFFPAKLRFSSCKPDRTPMTVQSQGQAFLIQPDFKNMPQAPCFLCSGAVLFLSSAARADFFCPVQPAPCL